MAIIEVGDVSTVPADWQIKYGHAAAQECGHAAELSQLRAKVRELQAGLATRQLIGTANGLVSARFSCTTDQSWAVLSRVSQQLNVKVREIARLILDAHNGEVSPEDLDMLARISAQLPDGWPGSLAR